MPTSLTAGSIAFTGFNGSGNDNLSFVVLTDITANTVITFTDNTWNGTSFASGSSAESVFTWTATSDVAAGTVIDLNDLKNGTPSSGKTASASTGTINFTNSANLGLSNDNETIYAYVGSASSPTFLTAITNIGFTDSNGATYGVLTNTGLTAGVNAVAFSGGVDTVGYNGMRTGETNFAAYLNDINNSANWSTAASGAFPTNPFAVAAPAAQSISFSPATVSVNEGDNGTKTLTFTVTRSGDTTGAISFSGTFDKGSTNAADFGGTLPASTFSGTIAAGATSAIVTITISGDTTSEASESLTLTLNSASNPNSAVTIGTATATGTIANDDGGTVVSSNTSSISLGNNDHVTILSNVTVSAVTWTGSGTAPGAVLDNFGNILGGTRAISTSGSSGGNLTIDNEAAATIQATKDAIKISNLGSGTSGTLTIVNDGVIKSTGTGEDDAGQALDLADIASSNAHTIINNNASGVIQAADADAIRGGGNATINNYGQIVSHNGSSASDGNDAIDFQARSGGVVNNYVGGLIDGARHGITGEAPITVNNGGTITGENGSGINLDSAGNTTTVVNNSVTGTIVGHAVAGADGDGVDVDGQVAIDNFGTIKAIGLTTGTNGLNEAIAVGGGTIHNEVGGLIVSDQRAITVNDSDDGSAFGTTAIINEGAIQGGNGEAISITGTFADTITNKGVITGSVAMGGGDDTFNAYTGSNTSGVIDGGAGNDTVHLLGNGVGAFGATANVETLDVDAGIWTVANTQNYDAINIAAGATLTSGISVTESMTVTVGGTLVPASGRAIDAKNGVADGSSVIVDVLAGGKIMAGDDAIRINKDFGNGTVTVDNAGLIQATGGQAIDLTVVTSDSTAITIINKATGQLVAIDADAVRGGGNTTIDNYGQILSVATGADVNDGIDFQDFGDGTVHNHTGGTIIGAHHGITGSQGITVINDASAQIIGQSGSAVNIDNDGAVANTVTVTNRGIMLGNANAAQADSDGDAVDVDGLLKLDNYGQIRGTGANGTHDGGANVSEGVAAGGGVINNHAGATIYGYGRAIQIDDSANGGALAATTIYNEGTIQGDGHGPENFEAGSDAGIVLAGREAIDILGTFADTITNKGTIIGGVFTDGGDDVFNAYVGSTSGKIDLGDGNDTINLQGTGTGSFGITTNVENLNVQSGTWTIAGSQNYKAIDVAGGATVAGTLTLGANEVLTVEQGGTVQGSKNAIVVSGGTIGTTVTNDGTIKVTATPGTKADAISISSGTATIHNTANGIIEGARHAITGPGAITVINDAGGLIVGHNGSAVNMDNNGDPANAANIINHGTMLGDSANIGDSDGDAVDVDGLANIDNWGLIRGEGHNGYHDGEANVSEGIAIGGGTIHNYAGGEIYGYGRAIEVDDSSNGNALGATTIINEGLIQGDGHGPTGVSAEDAAAMQARIDGREAIDILGTYADTITNKGTIIGGVFTDGGNDTLTNSGTMTALKDMAIDMGAGDDRVTNNAAGIITGSVALGDGNDSLSNDGTITVTHGNAISMGDGDDYMGVNGTITGNVDGGAGKDEVNIQSSGHINGTVSLGDGNDHLQSLGEIKAADASAVAIDMGAGDDTMYLYTGTTVQGTIQLGTGNDLLNSTADGRYVVDAGDGNDSVSMSGGDDVINGGAGNDSLDGGTGNDKVDGGEGNDTLFGGDGDDTVIGGTGSDLYYYWSGDGNDTIEEGSGNAGDFDTLSLRDFDISDVKLARNGDDLEITMKDGSKVVVSDQFVGGGVENIVLKDGEINRDGIVDATNHAPTVQPTSVTTNEDTTITGAISAADMDGDKLTYALKGDGVDHHGTITLAADGTWTYTPDQDYSGHDSFVVTVSDGHTTVDTTVDFTVNPVNDAPVAVADVGQVSEHDTASFDLVSNDTDVDNGTPHLTNFKVTGVDGIDLNLEDLASAFKIGPDGQLHFDGGDLFGSLNDGDHATVSISYTAEDGSGAQTTGEFVLTVDGVTDMNTINGTSGSDVLFDTGRDDHISGGDGNDVIFTSSGSDLVDAGKGDDTVTAITGNATINGGDGNDTILGGSGNAVLNGDNGNDTIIGGAGTAVLNGGAGNDTLIANAGNDIVAGGQGNDQLFGGAGNDTFVFKVGDGQDTVFGFQTTGPSHDVVEVDSHAFADFTALMAAVQDTTTGAQLQYADGSTITLSGVTKAHLTVDDFHFA